MASDLASVRECVAKTLDASGDQHDKYMLERHGIVTERSRMKAELATLRTALAEQSCLNAEARQALAIIADMATGPTGHEGNLLRQIADVALKAMEGAALPPREAEAYRRGVEDAAQRARECFHDPEAESDPGYVAEAILALRAAAIRELTADKEGA